MFGGIWSSRIILSGFYVILATILFLIPFPGHKGYQLIRGKSVVNLFACICVNIVMGLCLGCISIVTSRLLSIAMSILVYETVLILTINPLRRICSAPITASLWGLSNILYLSMISGATIYSALSPMYIVRVPKRIMFSLTIIWSIGTIIYFGRSILDHLSYRKYLNKDSYLVEEDSDDLRNMLFKKQRLESDANSVRLRISRNAISPVSIGIWNIEIVLPEQLYGEKELFWIFKHEFDHIVNYDSRLKLFLTLWNAIFWFVPPLSKALKNAADDIELSCDEEILKEASDQERLFYAELILDTAGNNRGFTSCLSAEGESLRYRIKSVVHPRKTSKIADYIVMILMTILLIGTFNLISFSYDNETISNRKFGGSVANQIRVVDGDCSAEEIADILDHSQATYIGDRFLLGECETLTVLINDKEYSIQLSDHIISLLCVDDWLADEGARYEYYYIG